MVERVEGFFFSSTSPCVHIGGALGHGFAPLRLLTVYSKLAKAVLWQQHFQYSLCIERVGLPLLPPLPSSTRLALFVDSHWHAWLYPCERTASNSQGKKKPEQRRFEANTHTCCRCLWCRHKQAQGMCHQSIARHICFFSLPYSASSFFPSAGKEDKE